MAAYFFDSSALVKRYISETGTFWVQSLVDPVAGHDLHIASITVVEIVSALVRRARGGDLDAATLAAILSQFHHDVSHQYRVIEITRGLVSRAVQAAESHALRAGDAVQLAVVLELATLRAGLAPLILISADRELSDAGQAEGLVTDDPNVHP